MTGSDATNSVPDSALTHQRFEQPLHVGAPNIGDRSRLFARINDILDRRWLTNAGPYVEEFESAIARLTGVKHAVVTCNATVALEILIRGLDLSGEVIVPSFTFVATAHSLDWHKVTPVFCDIDPETHNLDPHAVERLISPRTSAILAVHVWGRPCNTAALQSIGAKHGIPIIYDAAHAFGCSRGENRIGGFGTAEVFSFHATKFVNAGEGGAIATNDDSLAEKARLIRNFGFSGPDRVVRTGVNGKMTELSAAMGLGSLEQMPLFREVNRRNYQAYVAGLNDVPGIKLISYDEASDPHYHYIVAEIDSSPGGLTRDELQAVLLRYNILARRYFYPGCHRMEPYLTRFPLAGRALPHTERLCSKVLLLPTGTAVSIEAIGIVCNIVRETMTNWLHRP